MSSRDLNEEYSHINLIRENLQIIGNILLDHDGCLKDRLSSVSKAQLIEAVDYLEKEKDSLPNSYKYEVNIIIKAARYKLSHIPNQ